MSWVDLNGNERWDDEKHTARSEAWVRSQGISHNKEHILLRRTVSFLIWLFVQMLPDSHPMKPLLSMFGKPLSDKALAELSLAAQVYQQAEEMKDAATADGLLVNAALDVEDSAKRLAAIPPAPVADPDAPDALLLDPYADDRAAAQAQYDALLAAASPDVQKLLASRAADRSPPVPDPVVVIEAPAEEVLS